MALYIPPDVLEKAQAICSIPHSEDKDGITNYVIEVRVLPFKWQVIRRYRQFVELHEKMTKNFCVNKNLLPPKKIIGNRSESFIMERQKGLEFYLQTLLHRFTLLPEPLAIFLDFQKYEIRTITSILSEMLFNEGDEIIAKEQPFEFNPLQLHAITERLKLGDPPFYSNNPKQDIAHLVEFVTQLKHLKIVGSFKYFESSNIIPNYLSYDLSMFKFLETVEILNGQLEKNLIAVGALRRRLKTIKIRQSLTNLSTFLLCEILHWCPVMDPVQNWPFWQAVTDANFSHNNLTKIHPCIKLLAAVQKIDLSYNEIELIENMETLSELSVLILSHNKIRDLDHLHTRLGNIHSLNLSSNRIKCLHGLSKLFSVSELFLENNLITSMAEISNLSKLPCLGNLNLQNNPVTFTVDYRPQLLLKLGSLAPEITIDGVKTSEKEIDTVSILQALRDARNEPMPNVTHNGHLKGTNTKSALSVSSVQVPSKMQEQNNTECAVKKPTSNLHDVSKFRQQVETLRRAGGTDWLRLLNEMQFSSCKVGTQSTVVSNSNDPTFNDVQLQTIYSLDKNSSNLTAESIRKYQISHKLFDTILRGSTLNGKRKISIENISEAKVFWVIVLQNNDSSLCEMPICLLLLQSEIVFLKLHKLVQEMHEEFYSLSKVNPELVYERSIKPDDILSLSIGTYKAYVELKVKFQGRSENITILTLKKNTTNMLVKESSHLYKIESTYKSNPFANSMLDIEKVDSNFPVSKISVEKQIIFCQRVRVSKAFHKSQRGILHYIFVTPSHIVLMEERLHYPQVVELDITIKPQFQVCSTVSVHTNIKQIHLKDIDFESDCEPHNTAISEQENEIANLLPENEDLSTLNKCGFWLILEFESHVLLYLNFFSLKKRTEILDAFLGARSQR
ncbi:Nischarin like protein [Argiope bruennichi]|uniref:Nischarin like protein n=1 Tax=Argiope bruennichi TaxID=94029 RepID=A0A8T0F331_ARGBR|nr:Nischarin like protein [Argiope bruennichi]